MFRKSFFTLLACCTLGLTADEIKISVSSDPALPAPNIISNFYKNTDFENGLKGWAFHKKYTVGKDFEVVEDAGYGKAVLFRGYTRCIYGSIDWRKFTKGKTYIASCRIKPGKDLPATGKLGFGIAFWTKDWKKGFSGPSAQGAGPEKWIEITGKPVTIPEDIGNCQITVGMGYCQGSGCVDDLALREAFAQMKINVTAPETIRQVKIMDNTGKTVFDSGILKKEEKTFVKELQIETPYVYTVMVITSDGDVKSVTYPEAVKKK